jgi:hypothetical protein
VEGVELRTGGFREGSAGVQWGEETSGSKEVTLLQLGLDAVWEGDGSASGARARLWGDDSGEVGHMAFIVDALGEAVGETESGNHEDVVEGDGVRRFV